MTIFPWKIYYFNRFAKYIWKNMVICTPVFAINLTFPVEHYGISKQAATSAYSSFKHINDFSQDTECSPSSICLPMFWKWLNYRGPSLRSDHQYIWIQYLNTQIYLHCYHSYISASDTVRPKSWEATRYCYFTSGKEE